MRKRLAHDVHDAETGNSLAMPMLQNKLVHREIHPATVSVHCASSITASNHTRLRIKEEIDNSVPMRNSKDTHELPVDRGTIPKKDVMQDIGCQRS